MGLTLKTHTQILGYKLNKLNQFALRLTLQLFSVLSEANIEQLNILHLIKLLDPDYFRQFLASFNLNCTTENKHVLEKYIFCKKHES